MTKHLLPVSHRPSSPEFWAAVREDYASRILQSLGMSAYQAMDALAGYGADHCLDVSHRDALLREYGIR